MLMNKKNTYQATASPAPSELLKSPEVVPDGRVTFRIDAPKASEVTIQGEWTLQGRGTDGSLEKDSQGIWSITVGPLVPDFYTYTFTVDGVRTFDPLNPMVKQGLTRLENVFLVPGEAAAFEDNLPIPHGEIRMVWYPSSILNSMRRMHIYTPPGYESDDVKYPVLYLIHGGGDDDSAWSTIGRAGFIMDNLLEAGKVEPMIIVMPNGSIDLPGILPWRPITDSSSPAEIAARIEGIAKRHDAFAADLLQTIIPTVEKTYRVLTTRENRAIAGLSMGGAETLRVAPSNLDKFAYMGVFSMGLQVGANAGVKSDFEERNAAFLVNSEQTNKMLKLFWIACGNNDHLISEGARRLSDLLKRHGIRHEFHESEGGHTWINWRQYLRDFLPYLFRVPGAHK